MIPVPFNSPMGDSTTYVSPIGAQFSWNPADELTQIRRYDDFSIEIGDGTQPQPAVGTSDYTFDLAGRLSSLVHSGDATPDFRYDFDAVGRVVRETEAILGAVPKRTQFDYDDANQLTGADHFDVSSTEAYQYDDNGNRTGGGQVYDPQNRLVEDATFTYTYDAEGNLASKTRKSSDIADDRTTTYEWDRRNRLVSVTQTRNDPGDPQAITIEYFYDMFDRRISKNVLIDGTPVTGGFTGFVYSGGQLAFTRTSDGTVSDVFLPGALGDMLSQDHFANSTPGDQANQGWLLTDYRDSVRYVVNSVHPDAAIQYDSFGQIVGDTTPAEAHSLLGYIGQVFDAETGLGYFNARYYDPATGRFLSEDPIGFAGGDANLYRYVGNNPINLIDPSGLYASPTGTGTATTQTLGGAPVNSQFVLARLGIRAVDWDRVLANGTHITTDQGVIVVGPGVDYIERFEPIYVELPAEVNVDEINRQDFDRALTALDLSTMGFAPIGMTYNVARAGSGLRGWVRGLFGASDDALRISRNAIVGHADEAIRLGEQAGIRSANSTVRADAILPRQAPSKAVTGLGRVAVSEANAPFVSKGWSPPFHSEGAAVRRFTAGGELDFVRVHGAANQQGAFVVRAKEITGMTPQQIKQHLGLKYLPTHISDIHVPAGVRLQMGRVGAQPSFGVPKPGGIQYQLLDQLPGSSFRNMRPLP